VPPTVVYASEAIGRHHMLNVFAPGSEDQITSGLVLNANEYKLAVPIEAAAA
jgi:hypothetical protein